jgi:hypothetical protein
VAIDIGVPHLSIERSISNESFVLCDAAFPGISAIALSDQAQNEDYNILH